MTRVLSELLRGLIDYAGLFPPAALSMDATVGNYARYRVGAERWMLGRLIVPVSRLGELEAAVDRVTTGVDGAWQISAISGGDLRADLETIEAFNARNRERAIVDGIEAKVATGAGITAAARMIPKPIAAWFEIPTTDDPDPLIEAIATSERFAKIRTGGVTQDAFPPAAQIARFMARCNSRGVAFKATAGLHHPLRCVRPLTYEPESPVGTMHGFLNVFAAAALIHNGYPVSLAEGLLGESDAATLQIDDDTITWRGLTLTAAEVASCRDRLAISFGSCSFEEPVRELEELTGLAN